MIGMSEQEIVTEGKLFNLLELLSGGKYPIVHMPLYQPMYPVVFDESSDVPDLNYVEWKRVLLSDGTHGWRKADKK